MKKSVSLFLSFVLIICAISASSLQAFAVEDTNEDANTYIEYFDDGSYCVAEFEETVILPQTRSSTARTESKTLKRNYYYGNGTLKYTIYSYGIFEINPGVKVRCDNVTHSYYIHDTSFTCTSIFSVFTNSQYPVSCTTTAFMKQGNSTVRRDLTIYCDINGNYSIN